jgi:hypothetical protein
MLGSWEDYIRTMIPGITDLDLLRVIEIAEGMVIKGTAATMDKAVDALIAVLTGGRVAHG